MPQIYCCMIEDLYPYSTFKIICRLRLSKVFYIILGSKTGNPLSAVIFILVIARLCNSILTAALVKLNVEHEHRSIPLPIQVFKHSLLILDSI